MKLAKNLLLLSSIFLLSACGATGETTTSSTQEDNTSNTSSIDPIELSDIKDFISYFNTSKNYSFDLYIGKNLSKTLIFSEDVIGSYNEDSRSLLDLYIQDSEGVYKLNYFNKNYVSSEYLLNSNDEIITDLWSGEVISNLYGKADSLLSNLADGLNEYEISDKNFKLAIVKILGFEQSAILDISNINSIVEDNSIVLSFTIEETAYKLVSKDLGTSISNDYLEFINNGGGVYVPDYHLGGFKKLMKLNNYRDENISGSEPFYELFNPNYFLFENIAVSNLIEGYIGLNTADHVGTYSLTATGGLSYFPIQISDLSIYTKINTGYNIPEIMNYPSNLLILDNLQFLEKGELDIIGFQPVGETYITSSWEYLIDFGNNFNIFSAASDVYTNFTPYGLMIDIYYSEQNTVDSLVDFYYCFTYLDFNFVLQAGVFQFKFSEFGNCSVSLLDQVVSGEIQ